MPAKNPKAKTYKMTSLKNLENRFLLLRVRSFRVFSVDTERLGRRYHFALVGIYSRFVVFFFLKNMNYGLSELNIHENDLLVRRFILKEIEFKKF